MRYVTTREQSIIDVADAIRAKTGSSEEMTISEMPSKIENISGGKMTSIETVKISGSDLFVGLTVTISNYEGGE